MGTGGVWRLYFLIVIALKLTMKECDNIAFAYVSSVYFVWFTDFYPNDAQVTGNAVTLIFGVL